MLVFSLDVSKPRETKGFFTIKQKGVIRYYYMEGPTAESSPMIEPNKRYWLQMSASSLPFREVQSQTELKFCIMTSLGVLDVEAYPSKKLQR